MGITGQGRLASHLDTGVDVDHPAISSKWRGNQSGVLVSEAWFDPVTNTDRPFDSGTHGTHTMGTILGHTSGDTIGVAFNSRWISAGVIDRGGLDATISNALLALQWSADPDENPDTIDDVPDVSSNSWGLAPSFPGVDECDARYWQAIDNLEAATVVTVWAAGNEGRNGSQTLRSPADRITSPINTFSVGALSSDGQTIANYSSRGPSGCSGTTEERIKPEVVARGSSVRSSIPDNGYRSFNGTSMATPHVAGAVLLLREAYPNSTVEEIKYALMNTAKDLGSSGEDNTYGHGLIDVYAAYQYLSLVCENEITITNNITSNEKISANERITASSTVHNGITAVFTAGSEILLQTGFHAVNGSLFTASIQPCDNTNNLNARQVYHRIQEVSVSDELLGENIVETRILTYPNPASDQLHLTIKDELNFEPHSLMIIDSNGKIMFFKNNINLNKNTLPVQIENWPGGVYYGRVFGENNHESFKVLKK